MSDQSNSVDIFNSVKEFESKLSLPDGFYDKLLQEDDWSFTIKMSALFEAACTHALITKLNTPELKKSLSQLDQANSSYGKVTLLKCLNLIYPEQADFLTKLASLRNNFVHNVSNVELTFDQLIEAMDDNQKKAFVKWVGHGIVEKAVVGESSVTRNSMVLENPKLSIWITAAEVLACLYLEVDIAERLHSQLGAISKELISALLTKES